MITLAQLDTALFAAVGRLWPDSAARAGFVPLSDLRLGDAGSAIAIRLAEETGLRPEDICETIQSILEFPPGAMVHTMRGYLNVRFQNVEDILHLEPTGGSREPGIAIIFPPFRTGQKPLAYMRMAANACTQFAVARAMKAPVAFFLGEVTLEGTPAEVLRTIIRAIESPAQSNAPAKFVQASFGGSDELITAWIYPQSLRKEDFAALCQSLGCGGRRLTVECPTGPWLDFRNHKERVSDFLEWDNQALQNLSWYLAQDLPGSEIDFFVPRSLEEANLFWYWDSVVERGSRLLTPLRSKGFSHPGQGPAELSERLRTIAVRRKFFFTNLGRAGQYGEVAQLTTALRDLLSQVSRVLNSPDFRIGLENKGPETIEQQILAGAVQTLSDSITLCDFGEE